MVVGSDADAQGAERGPTARAAVSDERYARQVRLGCIGPAGQAALGRASVVVVGVGATGSAIAPLLVRAGVGRVRVIDRDIVERSNLQRQLLYTDADAERARPKAEAAAEGLRAANPDVVVEALARDLTAANADRLLGGSALVVDGTDNFEARFLVNDWCVRAGVPWVYIGAVGTQGHTLTILPGEGPCFRCYLPDPPPAGAVETCDTAGVLGPAVAAIAALASVEALKILSGRRDTLRRGLLVLDAWTQEQRVLQLARDAACPCCGEGRFDWLDGGAPEPAARLCGRAAVMVKAPARGGAGGGEAASPCGEVELAAVAARLRGAPGVEVREGPLALRVLAVGLDATLFADGRAIVRGTDDPGRARSFYARYLG
jgi:adenylyltransferase/sulfurtransferase